MSQLSEDFKKFGILKFHDPMKLFICQFEQDEQLAKSFLKHCDGNHNYQTRSITERLLDTPLLNTHLFGTQSTKYNCIADWNSFHKTFKDIPLSECSCFKITKLLMQRFLNKYILKLTILLCRSFGQISSIYFITCFVFVA